MKRRIKIVSSLLILIFFLTGCEYNHALDEELTKDEDKAKPTIVSGNVLEIEHEIESFKIITKYDIGEYDFGKWRITDSKSVKISAIAENLSEEVIVLVEHVHIDVSLCSTSQQLDGQKYDSMDDSFHGTSQDGFWITENYEYQETFTIEGYNQQQTEGWLKLWSGYGRGEVEQYRLTEENLIEYGGVYANELSIVYDILIKYPGEEFFHTISFNDNVIIWVVEDDKEEQQETTDDGSIWF